MTHSLQKPLYENYVLIAPDGQILCRCNKKKAFWYLDRNLGELIETNLVRLRFEPKGRGHAGDPFFMGERSNWCVVCGTQEDQTRHHVCPYCFRKHFPDYAKNHNSFDVVPLCVLCHDRYERHAMELKKSLAAQYSVPLQGIVSEDDKTLVAMKRKASALLHHHDRMSAEKIERLSEALKSYLNKDSIAHDDLEELLAKKHNKGPLKSFGECLVEKVEDLDEFIIMWRKHFIATMEPKFMPQHWFVDRRLCEMEKPW